MWMTKRLLDVKCSLLGQPYLVVLGLLLGLLLSQALVSAALIAPPGACDLPEGASGPEDPGPVPYVSLAFKDEGALAASADGPTLCEDDTCPDPRVLGRQSQTGAVAFYGVDDYCAPRPPWPPWTAASRSPPKSRVATSSRRRRLSCGTRRGTCGCPSGTSGRS